MSKNQVAETLKECQKAEAAKRLKAMEVMEEVVTKFVEEDVVYVSERQNVVFPAVLYFTESYPELVEKIKNFEESYTALVYHVQLTHTEIGKMYSMFYVSQYEKEWKQDFEDVESQTSYVNVWNGDVEEIGLIGFKAIMGGIVRTW